MWKLTLSSLAAGLVLMCLGVARVSAGEAVVPGQKIFTGNKCTQCHSIDSLKISKVKSEEKEEEEELAEGEEKRDPPDLSGVGNEHDPAFITKWLMKEEKIKGHKHKKKFKGSPEDLKVLADWLGTLKYNVPKKKAK